MITKMMIGSSFGGCINYVAGKDEAELLDSLSVRDYDTKAMIQDFELIAAQNQNIKNPVLHLAISFHKNDQEKLTNDLMKEIGQKLLDQMGLKDCQHILVRHHDNQNPHFHLVVNRISQAGKGVSNRYSKIRLNKVRMELEKQYPFLTPAKGKDLTATRTNKLKGEDKVKYQIYTSIKKEIKNCRNIDDLIKKLQNHGIETRLKYKRGSLTEVQGINFGKGGIWLKGSQVDKGCSYAGLLKQMTSNKIDQMPDQKIPSYKPSISNSSAPVHYGTVSQNVDEFEDFFATKRKRKFKF